MPTAHLIKVEEDPVETPMWKWVKHYAQHPPGGAVLARIEASNQLVFMVDFLVYRSPSGELVLFALNPYAEGDCDPQEVAELYPLAKAIWEQTEGFKATPFPELEACKLSWEDWVKRNFPKAS